MVTKIAKLLLLQVSRQNWPLTQAPFPWNVGSQLHNVKMSWPTKSQSWWTWRYLNLHQPKGKGSHCIMMCFQFSVIPKTRLLNHHINLKSCYRFWRLWEFYFKLNCILLEGNCGYNFLNGHNWFINIYNLHLFLVLFKSLNEADVHSFIHSFIYFTFHWSYTDVELVLYTFSIINKASVHKLCLIVVS